MNEQQGFSEAELRLALRGLRVDVAPQEDLWPGIAARLSLPRVGARPPSAGWPWAAVATTLLAIGLLWSGGAQTVRPVPISPPRAAALPLQAEALTLHYQAALRELGQVPAAPESWQQGLHALDHSAEQVLSALRLQPDSPQLLERLRWIYARRIALSRRALFA